MPEAGQQTHKHYMLAVSGKLMPGSEQIATGWQNLQLGPQRIARPPAAVDISFGQISHLVGFAVDPTIALQLYSQNAPGSRPTHCPKYKP